jgi:outer membrane protein assembly factor BamB
VPPSQRAGYYNWATPALFDGSAYVALSSQCDAPLTQGKLLRVSLSDHDVRAAWNAVSEYDSGGGIWTSPVVDRKAHTVFVTTGTRANSSQLYAQAIVALDTTSLELKTYWPLPPTDPTRDADWGTSPLLFRDSRGRSLVGAANKNGILYAFRRNHLNAGPVWQTRLAAGGPCPQCGEGTTSNGFFDGTRLFFAAGGTTIKGQIYPGSVRAIDPATGRFLWQVGLPSEVLGSLAGAHGIIVVPAASGGLYVIRASTGRVLYANQLTGHAPPFQPIYAAPKIADGYVFIGTTDGVFHAFKLPTAS